MDFIQGIWSRPAGQRFMFLPTVLAVSVLVSCEKKERSCEAGKTLVEGECVTDSSTPVERSPLVGGTQPPGQAGPAQGENPDQGADQGKDEQDEQVKEEEKKSPKKPKPPKIVAGSLGDVECSAEVVDGSSEKEDYLKCMFMGGSDVSCYAENSCKVTLTTDACNKELTRLKSAYPETNTTWTCS